MGCCVLNEDKEQVWGVLTISPKKTYATLFLSLLRNTRRNTVAADPAVSEAAVLYSTVVDVSAVSVVCGARGEC